MQHSGLWMAADLLSEYADRRRAIDAEFTRDLNDALLAADPVSTGLKQE